MTTITSLGDTTEDDTRKLLESQGISINRRTSAAFEIQCPNCEKNEAYVYFNKRSRVIVCNRKGKCGTSVDLWDYIASRQSISGNQDMLEYINKTLGYEFNQKHMQRYNKKKEEEDQEQKFFSACTAIFSNALNLNHHRNNAKVAFCLEYLTSRGYTKEQISQFKLGFFPDCEELVKTLGDFGYSQKQAEHLTVKYFNSVLNVNTNAVLYQRGEESHHRITITCYNEKRNITGFSIRKPTDNKDLKPKYLNNNEMRKTEYLFNFHTLEGKKEIVIVEGQFDALAASYLSSPTIQQKYHFVATGGRTVSDNQAQILKNRGFDIIRLFIDNDEAGNEFEKSLEVLRKYDINPFVVSIPSECIDAKDIDELLRKYPDFNLHSILDNPNPAVVSQIDKIVSKNSKNKDSITDIERAYIKKQCTKEIGSKLLPDEEDKYTEYLSSILKVDKEKLRPIRPNLIMEPTPPYREDIATSNPLKDEVKALIKEAIENQEEIDISVEIQSAIAEEQTKSIISGITNNLDKDLSLGDLKKLTETYNAAYHSTKKSKRYSESDFIQDEIDQHKPGLKTGFKDLDNCLTIQPASLMFIAGRPSHGKTSVMLNILRNMLEEDDGLNENKPDAEKNYKSFLFYSYEEPESKIVLKLILGVSEKDTKITLEGRGVTYQEKVRNHIKAHYGTNKMSNGVSTAWDKVFAWIGSGRLQILEKMPNAESLSNSIIKCINENDKPVAAVFIDYIQKLNSVEPAKKGNRQIELQSVCQTLLNTALHKSTRVPIILGAQMNREVSSLASLTLDNLRECGDIEQDANIVLGVWDEETAEVERDEKELEILNSKNQKDQGRIKELTNKLKNYQPQLVRDLIIKVLKNRDGGRNNRAVLKFDCSLFKITNTN